MAEELQAGDPGVLHVKVLDLVPWNWWGFILTGPVKLVEEYAKTRPFRAVEIGKGSSGHTFIHEGVPWMMWIEKETDFPTIAHESLHVVGGVLESRGQPYSLDGDEVFAYTMTWLIRQTLNPKGWKVWKPRSKRG